MAFPSIRLQNALARLVCRVVGHPYYWRDGLVDKEFLGLLIGCEGPLTLKCRRCGETLEL